jgi:hypothetical protein
MLLISRLLKVPSLDSVETELRQGMGLKQDVKDQIRSMYWSNMGDL